MKIANALGFLVTGLVMTGLPTLAPGIIATQSGFGSATQTMWLQFMGTLNAVIGLGYIGHAATVTYAAPALAMVRTVLVGRPALQRSATPVNFERA